MLKFCGLKTKLYFWFLKHKIRGVAKYAAFIDKHKLALGLQILLAEIFKLVSGL